MNHSAEWDHRRMVKLGLKSVLQQIAEAQSQIQPVLSGHKIVVTVLKGWHDEQALSEGFLVTQGRIPAQVEIKLFDFEGQGIVQEEIDTALQKQAILAGTQHGAHPAFDQKMTAPNFFRSNKHRTVVVNSPGEGIT